MCEETKELSEGKPSLFGLVCPECGTTHLTPPGYVLITGEAVCQVCGSKFGVTEEVALMCNANRALLRAILGSVGVKP